MRIRLQSYKKCVHQLGIIALRFHSFAQIGRCIVIFLIKNLQKQSMSTCRKTCSRDRKQVHISV